MITAHWLDSFHTDGKVMAFEGSAEPGGAVVVHGSYDAPSGPPWGWTIRVESGGDTFRIVMHNVSPEGEQFPAVEADYARN